MHFEFQVVKPEQALRFYKDTFRWDIKGRECQTHWLITAGKEVTPGTNGGFLKRDGPQPKESSDINAFVCTVDVSSIEETSKKIISAGGVNVVSKSVIPVAGHNFCSKIPKEIFSAFTKTIQPQSDFTDAFTYSIDKLMPKVK